MSSTATATATPPRGAMLTTVIGLTALAVGAGLGSSSRLSYHEAIVAQAAREMIATGDLVTPTIGGRPWLEKPPLAIWLVAASGSLAGGLDEASARLPSAVAACALAAGVALLAAGRFGPGVGLLAGLIQGTTVWTVVRGRLAEADILLACLVTWAFLALDRLRLRRPLDSDADGWPGRDAPTGGRGGTPRETASSPCPVASQAPPQPPEARPGLARWGLFGTLGLLSMAKGVGFGPALFLAALAPLLAWDRDRKTLRILMSMPGWLLAAALVLAWPALAASRHPAALGLWVLHVTDRLSARPEHFIGQSWPAFAGGVVVQLLPWAPLAALGAWRSAVRAVGRDGRGGGDRLLWAWAVGPLTLLSLATVKNAHYAIHALPPCSVWAALGLARLGGRLQSDRGWSPRRVRRLALASFAGLGLAYAVGFSALGPRLDRRGTEWAFYEEAARHLRPGEPLSLLYHVPNWDRKPYETPFGPVPHDYAVRLFYLNRPDFAACRFGSEELGRMGGPSTFAVIGRPSDAPELSRLGRVEALAAGPTARRDRSYVLYRVTPTPAVAADPGGLPRR